MLYISIFCSQHQRIIRREVHVFITLMNVNKEEKQITNNGGVLSITLTI